MSRRGWFRFWSIAWIGSLPLGLLMGYIARQIAAPVLTANDLSVEKLPISVPILNLLSILLTLYLFLGWIPVLITYNRMTKAGKPL